MPTARGPRRPGQPPGRELRAQDRPGAQAVNPARAARPRGPHPRCGGHRAHVPAPCGGSHETPRRTRRASRGPAPAPRPAPGPHLRGRPGTSPGSSCRYTWTSPRYSPSSSSLCPAGEAERVRQGGARPGTAPLARPSGPAGSAARAHRHLSAPRLCAQAPTSRPLTLPVRAGAARLAGALLGNIWRRLRRGPGAMAAAAAALARLAAAFLLLTAQVRAAPASRPGCQRGPGPGCCGPAQGPPAGPGCAPHPTPRSGPPAGSPAVTLRA